MTRFSRQVRSLQMITVQGNLGSSELGKPDEGVVSIKLLSDQYLAPGTSVTGTVAGKIFKGTVTKAPSLQVRAARWGSAAGANSVQAFAMQGPGCRETFRVCWWRRRRRMGCVRPALRASNPHNPSLSLPSLVFRPALSPP
eukprot:733069-Rhodomonas_salina.1